MGHKAENGTKGINSPFPAVDSGSAALRRPGREGREGRGGWRGWPGNPGADTGQGHVADREIADLDEPAAPSSKDIKRGAGAKTYANACHGSALFELADYEIDAGSARALNLARRYAVQKPVVLSWKKDNTLVGRSARRRAGRRPEGRPGVPNDLGSALASSAPSTLPKPASTPTPAPEEDIIDLTDIIVEGTVS